MKLKVLLPLIISVGLTACHSPKKTEGLPFFNSASFSPEWISSNGEAFGQIHTIAPFQFIDQNGVLFGSEQLKGTPYVADFFFTLCPSICPKMTSNLAEIQNSFEASEVQLVSFSAMPWADSVTVLRDYAEARAIDDKQWHLLTGDTGAIYTLARKSFFAEKEMGLNKNSNEFLHTENFILVDGSGRIRGVYNGTLSLEMKRLKEDLQTLLTSG
ncbi:MAG: SCO family protein [Bacteroidota bacterium]|nr:SCO family protein [Bacteroidota bacterium]